MAIWKRSVAARPQGRGDGEVEGDARVATDNPRIMTRGCEERLTWFDSYLNPVSSSNGQPTREHVAGMCLRLSRMHRLNVYRPPPSREIGASADPSGPDAHNR